MKHVVEAANPLDIYQTEEAKSFPSIKLIKGSHRKYARKQKATLKQANEESVQVVAKAEETTENKRRKKKDSDKNKKKTMKDLQFTSIKHLNLLGLNDIVKACFNLPL